ncbi:MAG: caspase family protein, partial [Hyphomicrobiaceae bacterium]|nr:caspase family protein [Hyphomicrobiaceae bacterium]
MSQAAVHSMFEIVCRLFAPLSRGQLCRCCTAMVTCAILVLNALPAAAQSNRESIAVIIGNKNYKRSNPKTHDVAFAHNDAAAMRTFVIERLGYRASNVIFITDATLGKMREVFGSDSNPEGQLWN